MTSSKGDVTSSKGDIASSAGDVTSSKGDIASSAGDMVSSAGDMASSKGGMLEFLHLRASAAAVVADAKTRSRLLSPSVQDIRWQIR